MRGPRVLEALNSLGSEEFEKETARWRDGHDPDSGVRGEDEVDVAAGPTSQRGGLGCGCVRHGAAVDGRWGQPHAHAGGKAGRAGMGRSKRKWAAQEQAGTGVGFDPRSI